MLHGKGGGAGAVGGGGACLVIIACGRLSVDNLWQLRVGSAERAKCEWANIIGRGGGGNKANNQADGQIPNTGCPCSYSYSFSILEGKHPQLEVKIKFKSEKAATKRPQKPPKRGARSILAVDFLFLSFFFLGFLWGCSQESLKKESTDFFGLCKRQIFECWISTEDSDHIFGTVRRLLKYFKCNYYEYLNGENIYGYLSNEIPFV